MEPKQNFISSLLGGVKKLNPFRAWEQTYYTNQPTSTPATVGTTTPTTGLNREDFRRRISYAETRGESDPYGAVGVTGDLGRYQVSPQTLETWSPHWLGQQHKQDSFLNNQEAQTKFFDEYMNVADNYGLKPEEAAIVWHKGWGVLGNTPKDKRRDEFRRYVDRLMTDPDSQQYISTFQNAQ